MRIFEKLSKTLKKYQILLLSLAAVITIAVGILQVYDRVRLYLSLSENEKSKTLQIEKGETRYIFNDDLLQLTVDNILQNNETKYFEVSGKLDNGYLTRNFANRTQGESMQFERYIIQINKIESEYAIFRVSIKNSY